MIRDKIIQLAEAEIGTGETPQDSNKTKYGEWAKLNGVAWCAIFVSYIYEMSGKPLPKIGFKFNGYAGCQTGYNFFKESNWLTNNPQKGDIVLFDWNGDNRHDHTGIFVRDLGNGFFESIEGNTGIGNDSNGGQVMKRKRSYKLATFVKYPELDK